ncbi:MAG: flagellar motor switch protein FliM [Alphaproteobacteria bacterium]|nr:flagellar motor switch protein FliM [Alphaproteobacteria bacterium]MCL2505657.1 flagellar motor switch protein FliM [Alphaproteobacteria bacterium]
MAEEKTEEEKMMEAWAAESGSGEEGADNQSDSSAERMPQTGGSAKVLSQNEIDSLLGFGDVDTGQETSGVMALINSALVNYERLPMLEIVFDRLVRMLSTNLRNFTSDNVDVSIDHITSVRFGDYLNSIPLPAMLCVFRAEEWDNSGLMTIDSSLIYSIVDVLLGGRKGTAQMRIEGRPYTTIERNLVGRLAKVILADMSSAFDPLSPVTFKFDRLETNPRFATIARPANAAVLVKLRIDMEERGGRIEILIPYATLEPIRELLLQMFMGEKFGRDSIWEAHLSNELLLTDIKINAVLDSITVSLKDVMNWKPGSKLVLNVKADDTVSLCSGNVPLFKGKMGSLSDRVAVRVEDVLIKHNSIGQQ